MGSRNSGKKPDFKTESDLSPPRLLRPRGICSKCHFPLALSCFCSSSNMPGHEGKVRASASPVSSETSTSVPPIVMKKRKISNERPARAKSRSPSSCRRLFRDEFLQLDNAGECVTTSTSLENVSADFTETSSVSSSSEQSGESSSSHVAEEDLAVPSTSFEPLPSTSTADAQPAKTKRRKKKLKVLGRHVCRVCCKVFGSPGKLSQHMFSHTGEKPFECDKCLKAFSSKFKLVRHLLIHSDERQYRCTMCDRTFHRKDHLKNHFKVHSPVKKTFRCDKAGCLKVYSSLLSYRKHAAVHAAEEGDLDCKMCGKSFVTKDEIVYHLKVHAGSRTVKNPSDKKYRCEFCDRRFFTRKDVRRHLVVHTGKRDFLCQYCPHRFGRKDHLVRHIKKSHSNVSVGLGLRVTMSKAKRLRSSVNVDTPLPNSVISTSVSPKQRGLVCTLGKTKATETSDLQTNLQTDLDDASHGAESGVIIVVHDSDFAIDTKPCKPELSLDQLKVEDLISGENDPVFHSDNIKIEECAMIPDLQPILYSQPPPSFPEHLPVSLNDPVDGPIKSEPSLTPLPVDMDMNQFMSGLLDPSNDTGGGSETIENEQEDNRTSISSETQSATGMSDAEATEFLAHFSNDDEIMQLMELSMPITSTSASSSMDAPSQTTTLPRFNQAFQQQPP